jgi:phospholipid/cholesterol/gamma-HCH transport system permease protein
MKAGEQLAAMELMAIDPRARAGAALHRRHHLDALLAILFSAIGILGAWVVAVG